MILDFAVTNWKSYRDEAELNMVAGRQRAGRDRLARIPGFRTKKAVPVAAVYGANASGKTNLFDALATLKAMVLQAPGFEAPLPVQPFLLGAASLDEPTTFDLTFAAGTDVFRYVVAAGREGVLYESLERLFDSSISRRESELIFERYEEQEGGMYLSDTFFEDAELPRLAFRTTRDNQLFMNAAVLQNVRELVEPYGWFSETLNLVGVDSDGFGFALYCVNQKGFLEYAGQKLRDYDTGVDRIEREASSFNRIPKVPGLQRGLDGLKEGDALVAVGGLRPSDYGFEVFVIEKENGKVRVSELVAVHRTEGGGEAHMSLSAESSGTQRVLDLLPMLFDFRAATVGGERVYVVDELDRCFHSNVTKRIVSDFLASCGPDTRKQLLFTAHDLFLMDQSLLRRDEMFVAERGPDGASTLVSLEDFEGVRTDKDLVKSYLEGRFGGVPRLSPERAAHGEG